ncbi:strawberry notch-like protein [Dermatophagoides farinae]|uniref:Strawberry notch-like protein n=2 Tax=Dermatophagoides farinae TaxID=6954 RepID=A0A9D4NSC2_DERFA|nr:strawberry notch-like protein [Dermatophagoides farinae]
MTTTTTLTTDILSAALDECGLGDFFANPIVHDDLTNSLPNSPGDHNTIIANNNTVIVDNNNVGHYQWQQSSSLVDEQLLSSNTAVSSSSSSDHSEFNNQQQISTSSFDSQQQSIICTNNQIPTTNNTKATIIPINAINTAINGQQQPLLVKKIQRYVLTKNNAQQPRLMVATSSSSATNTAAIQNSNNVHMMNRSMTAVQNSKLLITSQQQQQQQQQHLSQTTNMILNDISNQKKLTISPNVNGTIKINVTTSSQPSPSSTTTTTTALLTGYNKQQPTQVIQLSNSQPAGIRIVNRIIPQRQPSQQQQQQQSHLIRLPGTQNVIRIQVKSPPNTAQQQMMNQRPTLIRPQIVIPTTAISTSSSSSSMSVMTNGINNSNQMRTSQNRINIQSSNIIRFQQQTNGSTNFISDMNSNPSTPKTPLTPSKSFSSSSSFESKDDDQLEKDIRLSEEMRRLLEDNEEELANLETFADYMPTKLKIGLRHPDQVVETSSLASIPPPDVYYQLMIPDEVIDDGRLSALQLESIIYASQQHENFLRDGSRSGFLIGDGAGVGKGRTVAGIIYENYLRGRKRALWFSVSTDLKYDAERDLHDIGASRIEVHLLNKFKYGIKIHSPDNDNVKRGVIFSTYHSLIGESTSISGRFSTRFQQVLQWCGEDFDGVIIFDECHKAKNLFPSGTTRATKTGQAVLDLQRCLPKARVVYASATGATEPKNMGYMTRLGIWGPGTPFEDFNQFVAMVEKRGVGAMELVAIDLKMRGMYMARQLSFKGVQFRIEHVPLSREFIRIYNCCCRLWVSAKTKFEKALELMEADPQVSKAIWTQFWASHQRFFKYLCIASKVKFAVAFVKESLRCDKSVVIGLQSTGEARTLEQLEDNGGELNDFVSTAKSVFQSLVERHFPAPNRKKLAKLLGRDTSFFDDLGIKLKRDANDEIIASISDDDDEMMGKVKRPSGHKFFDSDDDEDDDFVEVPDDEDDDDDDDDKSDDSDIDFDEIDDIMDEKLGLKPGGKPSASLKFMDILLGPSSSSSSMATTNGRKRKRKALSRQRQKRIRMQQQNKRRQQQQQSKKSLKKKYEKYYNDFNNVGSDIGGYCEMLKNELLEQLESFGERLPPNTLDELIDELGGPEQVAEMTGRKGRIVSTQDGQVQYEARSENDVSLEMLNLVEKQRFMDDEKRVAIISEAASSGISLHADRRARNRCRRVHLTVELPWSADRAIQQFGRTHRSNQVSAPEYVFLISKLAGEKRFASIVAKRLESLGALTHGDRRATESRDLSQFNIDTKYGRQALEFVMKSIQGSSGIKPLVSPPENYSSDDFFEDCRVGLAGVGLLTIDRKTGAITLDKDYANINKFLNRILGLEVELQNSLFRYFNDTMDAVIKGAKRSGRYDSGIIDLSNEVGNVRKLDLENFILKSSSRAVKIQLHTVSVDRGISFERADNLRKQAFDEETYFKDEIGYYVSNSTYQIRKTIFLAIPEENPQKNKDMKQIFRIYKPSLGLQAKYETKNTLKERGQKLNDMEQVAKLWNEHYEKSVDECTHLLLFGRCRASMMVTKSSSSTVKTTSGCDVGIRKRNYCVLSGAVMTVWPEIEKAIPQILNHKLQVVRLKTEDNLKYIGPLIPPMYVDEVRKCLNRLANGEQTQSSSSSL